MNKTQPIFDPTTHYQIEVRGRVEREWLLGFDSSAEVTVQESWRGEDISVLDVHTDQSGIIGLVRRLHGLGITILELQIIPEGGKPGENLL